MRALVLAPVLVAGIVLPLDRRAIFDAVAIANSSLDSTHRRFHADYHVPIHKPPVDFASVVSPFRRLVLIAETEKRHGRRAFGQREALAALESNPDRFELYIELTLHPHNTFIGVPDFQVEMQPASFRGPAVAPREVERIPRFGPRLDEAGYPFPYPYAGPHGPPGGQPLVGGTLIARFDGSQLNPTAIYDIVVTGGDKAVAKGRTNLARLR